MGMTLFHAQTMKELRIDKVIEQSYNEDSQEYKEFDKELMKGLAREAKEVQKETIEQIEQVVKNCYYQGTTAYISFGGYMINPKEFCAIRLDGFDIQFNKK